MGRLTFSAGLSVKELDDLRKKLLEYRDKTLQKKIAQFVKELAESGIPTVERDVAAAGYTYDGRIQSGSDTTHDTYVVVDSTNKATLVLEGEEVLFIEFGAGVTYNGSPGQSPHSKGEEKGFLIGTYGLGHGSQRIWGYYDENKELVLTHGTKATMPMYNASLDIINNVATIARRVFG